MQFSFYYMVFISVLQICIYLTLFGMWVWKSLHTGYECVTTLLQKKTLNSIAFRKNQRKTSTNIVLSSRVHSTHKHLLQYLVVTLNSEYLGGVK